MKRRITQAGRSHTIRIPPKLIDQSGLSGQVDVRVKGRSLVIGPAVPPRQRWDEAFAAMARHDDDALLNPDVPGLSWDETEWEWK